jgi:VWFA-related protein
MPFTTDTAQLQNALDQSTARGQTALFDGVRAALKHLADGHEQRKVLIVVSDGGDNASTSKFSDVLDMALRMDAVIYAIGMYDQYDRDAKPDVLRKLAKSTGGVAYFPHDPGDATKILEEIARDIRSGYTLGYVPSSARSGYRTIRVEVHSPDNRKLSVRARAGYVAGPTTSDARK